MKLRTTIVLEYDVDDATLTEAFGSNDPVHVAAIERGHIDDSGDYVLSLIAEADVMTVTVEPA